MTDRDDLRGAGSGFGFPTDAICYASGEESVPQHFGNVYNAASAMFLITHDGGISWSKITFAKPAKVPSGMQGDAFMAVGDIQCPRLNACVALGVSDQGRSPPRYTRAGVRHNTWRDVQTLTAGPVGPRKTR